MIRALLAAISLIVLAPDRVVAGPGGEPLPPPFGLSWGDSPARLVVWARRTGLDQLVREPGGNQRLAILMISSPKGQLPGHDASMLEARFLDGRLYEVTLHYTYPGRKATFVKGQFISLKRLLTVRHGAFKPNGIKEETKDGIVTKSEAYQVKPDRQRYLLLALTEVRDAKRGDAAAKFSVVYHNDGVLMDDQEGVGMPPEGIDLPDPAPASESE